jgi:hypothetical protein
VTFMRNPPGHLTDFGVWLWLRWPFLVRERVASGEAFHGLKSPRGLMFAGVLTDYYHGLWPWGFYYWRRSVWVLNFKVLEWRRVSRGSVKPKFNNGEGR